LILTPPYHFGKQIYDFRKLGGGQITDLEIDLFSWSGDLNRRKTVDKHSPL
jgi:hypothetical protein